ncbi:MAG: hypothetical protein LBI57_08095 [Helicobacteraceae bacterium]|jgi:hypothetical protein|nr:hypothetical protein [Helicobacteraceae bacterium]
MGIGIQTETELSIIRSNLKCNYILLNNITLTNVTQGDASGAGRNPIGGTTYIDAFQDVFDGNVYTIGGLWINRPTTDQVSLFRHIHGATIKHLSVLIDDSKGGVKGRDDIGGIVGYVECNSLIANKPLNWQR